jgi:hypothetical protein
MPSPRRFPAPWSAELQPNYYVVRDADGQQLAYIYYSNDPDRRSAAKLLTKDEASRIAANIAKPPELLSGRSTWGVRSFQFKFRVVLAHIGQLFPNLRQSL